MSALVRSFVDTMDLSSIQVQELNLHPGRLCRLCASVEEEEKLTFIFSESDSYQDSLADIINIVLPVKVSQIDPLPKQICELCLEKLQATHEFVLTCVAAEQELEDLKFQSDVSNKNDVECANEEDRSLFEAKMDPKAFLDSSDALTTSVQDVPKETHALVVQALPPPLSVKCPLCCEGEMGVCSGEPLEFDVLSCSRVNKSFEEELMIQYNQANEEDDSSASVVEQDSSDTDGPCETEPVSEHIDMPFIPSEAEIHDKSTKRKLSKQVKTRIKRRYRKRGKVDKGLRNQKLADKDESDALIWIKADNEQSIPLVQCIHCSGWLPGYASCLEHTFSSHIDISETDEKSFLCPRCDSRAFSSSDLVTHFIQTHCPDCEFEVVEDNGLYLVSDKSRLKTLPEKDVTYHCTICKKGFSWLLNLLRHSCSQVNCNNMYCNNCDQHYRNRQRFVFHTNFHSSKAPPLECDVCNQSFGDDSELYDHVRFAHITENVVCSECGKCFRSDKGLASHQLSAHNKDPSVQNRHKCTICGKTYRDKQGLKDHLVTHMTEKPFQCDKCDRAYNRYSRLKQHQISHLYTETMECYDCSICGLAFPDVDKALLHSTSEGHEVQTAILNKIYRCEFCDTVFSCPDGLNQHRPSHVGDKPYVCHICGSSFHTYARVTTHKTTHGIYDQLEPQEGDFTIPRYFLCEHCGVSYPYWSYLQTHRKMRHSENPYSLSCKLCPEKFKNSWSVIYHRRKVHEQNGTVKEWRKRSLQCPHCGVNCLYPHTLNMHIERKHGGLKDDDGKQGSYQCEECGKVFKYQSSLSLHQKMHQGQRNFQCQECDKAFLTIATLRNHTKRCHQGIKPHKCEFCGKAFFHRIARDDHLRVHTGEKPFKCQFCDKQFRLKSMLADHAKIHNDARPYPCDVCGSSFRRMVHMKQHRMLHTGEKPFQCKFCGHDFRLKQELQRHVKTRHGESSVETVEEDELFIFAD